MKNVQSKNIAESAVLVSDDTGTQEKLKQDNSVGLITIVADTGTSFVQSAVINPVWNGLGQLVSLGTLPQISIVNTENAAKSSVDNWAQKIGCALGVAADFYLLTKFKCRIFGEALSAEKAKTMPLMARVFSSAKESAKLGAFYGAVLTPSQADQGLLWGRVANAGAEAITFAALGGGVTALRGVKTLGKLQPNSLANTVSDMGIAGVAGIPAGALGSVVHATANGRPISVEGIKDNAIDFGIIGFALAGITHGASLIRPAGFSMKTQSATDHAKTESQGSPRRTVDPGVADEVRVSAEKLKVEPSRVDTGGVLSARERELLWNQPLNLRQYKRAIDEAFPIEAGKRSEHLSPGGFMIGENGTIIALPPLSQYRQPDFRSIEVLPASADIHKK